MTLPQLKTNFRLALLVLRVMLLVLVISSLGCRAFRSEGQSPNLGGKPPVNNPLIIPMMDRWLVMDQISDEMDDYFKIYREERIRVLDGVMSEGWIETHPKIGSTLLEPWNHDSTPGFERLHSTLQTVRRFAKVRVIPSGASYQLDLKVYKELEDLQQPIGSAISGQLRHDSALDVGAVGVEFNAPNQGWIPMGRDFSLEQQILRNIQQRLSRVLENGGPPVIY